MKPPSFLFLALAFAPAIPLLAQNSATPPQSTPAAAAQPASADPDPAYTKTITERADKIVDPLGIDDSAKKSRVRDIIVLQYRNLHAIDDVLSPKLAAANKLTDKDAKAAALKAANDESDARRYHWHAEFLARLSAELTPEQIDKVKDGLTYNALHVNYDGIMNKQPNLTDDQKKQIMTWFVEAREIAMDDGSSSEKDKLFVKYRGRVNNYLSAAGINTKAPQKNPAESASGQPAAELKPATP